MPVEILSVTNYPSIACVYTGVWSSVEEACCCIKQTKKFNPSKKLAEPYDRSYAVYSKLYGDLKERFPEMTGQ